MSQKLGWNLKRKIKAYSYPRAEASKRFGILIDETDPSISKYISQIEKHPLFKKDVVFLAFSTPEFPSNFELSYHKKMLPWDQWPIKDQVEQFICHDFKYFIPIVFRWQSHLKVIANLVQSEIKFARSKDSHFIPWNLALVHKADHPLELLNFASTFVQK